VELECGDDDFTMAVLDIFLNNGDCDGNGDGGDGDDGDDGDGDGGDGGDGGVLVGS